MSVCEYTTRSKPGSARGAAHVIALTGLVLALVTTVSPPARGAELQKVDFRVGELLEPTDVNGWSIGLEFDPDSPPRWLQFFGGEVHYQVSVGQWLDTGADGNDDIQFIEGGPVFRYRPAFLADRWYLDWGVGLSLMSDDDIGDDREAGGPPLFLTDVTLARAFGKERRWHGGLRFRHVSNGGFLGDDGQGANIVTLELSYRFGSI